MGQATNLPDKRVLGYGPKWGPALPAHHVPRPRLVKRLTNAQVSIVVAPAGYGKTLLAQEMAAQLGLATVNVALGPRPANPAGLVTAALAALSRANLVDAANAVKAEQADPAAAIDALAATLAREREPVLVVVDDAHFLDASGGELLAHFARAVPVGHRLVIFGRALPPLLRPARGAPGAELASADLAFTPAEVVALAETSQLELSPSDAENLVDVTAGWAAALVVAVERMSRADNPRQELASMDGRASPLQYLVRTYLGDLPAEMSGALVQLSHLPLLSPAVAAKVTGDPGMLDQIAAAGLPLGRRADGWWELPGPVQELLRRYGPLSTEAARGAAEVYAQSGELAEAVHLLVRGGEADAAAGLLAAASVKEVYSLGYLAVRALVDAVPTAAVHRHPAALLQLARACEPAAQTELRAKTLQEAHCLAVASGDGPLIRAVRAELSQDLVRDGHTEQARGKAGPLLAQTGALEATTRARLIDVMGRAAAWERQGPLDEAERLLQQAELMYAQLGEDFWASQVTMPLAFHVYYTQGKHEQALACIEKALARLPARSRTRGVIVSFYGDILADCGRFDEAGAAAAEGRELGQLFADHRISAYAEWTDAKRLSPLGEAEATVRCVRATETHWHDWSRGWTGAVFLADAANLLDRVGETELALGYLDRARARRNDASLEVALGEAAVLARSGDPAQAEQALDQLQAMPRLERRDQWWVTLLRAYATMRAGRRGQAGVLAAQAFEEAASLGKPFLPLARERTVAEQLLTLAARAGSLTATKLAPQERPVTIRALGHFEVRRAGELIILPPGKPEQLVKLLAVWGGRCHAEAVIEALWPDVEAESGRKRLRNVLNRLRTSAGDLVRRQGDSLVLARAEVDADTFVQEASLLLGGGSISPRLVLARYAGPLLPDERYEDWAAAPRERLERTLLCVLDTATKAAERAGDVDEALRYIDRSIEIEPYEESRYLRGARLLLQQGRRGSALALLARGERSLGELGVKPSSHYRQVMAEPRS